MHTVAAKSLRPRRQALRPQPHPFARGAMRAAEPSWGGACRQTAAAPWRPPRPSTPGTCRRIQSRCQRPERTAPPPTAHGRKSTAVTGTPVDRAAACANSSLPSALAWPRPDANLLVAAGGGKEQRPAGIAARRRPGTVEDHAGVALGVGLQQLVRRRRLAAVDCPFEHGPLAVAAHAEKMSVVRGKAQAGGP